ncbi:kyphoscoliosis peptidase-like [Erpetoichthys calabaricus]|uniref:kyphoscoliosis peptidase-like n=1 Tax=Erpetoichthys calabaricus TaxID=27687 RepID=UPI002234E597|nr:kyphoscoliosis peptidase-like [Erpetoichthys calabaricus]
MSSIITLFTNLKAHMKCIWMPSDQTSVISKSPTSSSPKHKKTDIPGSHDFEKSKEQMMSEVTGQTLKKVVTNLCKLASTERERVWLWVCTNIAYDVEFLQKKSSWTSDHKVVFKKRKAICAGYATLFYEMCRLAHIKCVKIHGNCKPCSIKNKSTHSWNAVCIDGAWYLIDATWGAGYVNKEQTKFIFKLADIYFLADPVIFAKNHTPNESKWTLLHGNTNIHPGIENEKHTAPGA